MTKRAIDIYEWLIHSIFLGSTSEALKYLEEQAQRDLMAQPACYIPKEQQSSVREILQSSGAEFLGDSNDPLYELWDLPEGWKIEPTVSSRWAYVVDGKGRHRIDIFDKSVVYDKKAQATGLTRFCVLPISSNNKEESWVVVLDGQETIYKTERFGYRDEDAEVASLKFATFWLSERYPDWRNPLAYWDDSVTDLMPIVGNCYKVRLKPGELGRKLAGERVVVIEIHPNRGVCVVYKVSDLLKRTGIGYQIPISDIRIK